MTGTSTKRATRGFTELVISSVAVVAQLAATALLMASTPLADVSPIAFLAAAILSIALVVGGIAAGIAAIVLFAARRPVTIWRRLGAFLGLIGLSLGVWSMTLVIGGM